MIENVKKVLLITDMDGTFLPASKIPGKKSLEAVDRLMSAGGKFSIATGRSLQASQQYFDRVKVNCPIIMCNGGMVYDLSDGRQIYDVYLPDSAKDITKRILKRFPEVGCECLPIDGVYVPQMTDMEREHCKICKVTPHECSVDEIPPLWYKTLFAYEAERLHEVIEYVENEIMDDYPEIDFVVSSPVYYEMLPKNISKGSALKELRRACGMEDCTIVAVGDYNNDIEMLEEADIGICPSNAVDEVKAVADVCLEQSCEEDAIAAAVEYIFDNLYQ